MESRTPLPGGPQDYSKLHNYFFSVVWLGWFVWIIWLGFHWVPERGWLEGLGSAFIVALMTGFLLLGITVYDSDSPGPP